VPGRRLGRPVVKEESEMDEQRFDRLVKALGRSLNRRGVLGVLAGAVGLGVGEVAAKGQRSRQRTQAQAANKVAVCHYDADADTYVELHLTLSSWEKGHAKHTSGLRQGGSAFSVAWQHS
jgi:hypothetical protein